MITDYWDVDLGAADCDALLGGALSALALLVAVGAAELPSAFAILVAEAIAELASAFCILREVTVGLGELV